MNLTRPGPSLAPWTIEPGRAGRVAPVMALAPPAADDPPCARREAVLQGELLRRVPPTGAVRPAVAGDWRRAAPWSRPAPPPATDGARPDGARLLRRYAGPDSPPAGALVDLHA